MHYNLLNNEATYEKARKVQGRLIKRAIGLGGVPSAEHGIGAKTALIKVAEEDGIAAYQDVPLLEIYHGNNDQGISALEEVQILKAQLGAEGLNRGSLVPMGYNEAS